MVTARRKVTDEDFRVAYYGRPDDEASLSRAASNRSVIRSVLKSYRKSISPDDLESCGMYAMYRCLQYHDDSYGQSFTTSLHRFVHWECRRRLLRMKKAGKPPLQLQPGDEWKMVGREQERLDYGDPGEHVRECLDLLPEETRNLLRMRYYDGLSVKEIASRIGVGKETARVRLIEAVCAIREVYQEDVGESVGVLLVADK